MHQFRDWQQNPEVQQVNNIFISVNIEGRKLGLNRIGEWQSTYAALETLLQDMQRENNGLYVVKAAHRQSLETIKGQRESSTSRTLHRSSSATVLHWSTRVGCERTL